MVLDDGWHAYLSDSFAGAALLWTFFLFGLGIRHSIEKATQLVQGTPRLAASQRTCHDFDEQWSLGVLGEPKQSGLELPAVGGESSYFAGMTCLRRSGQSRFSPTMTVPN